ncbi:MAG: (Fe-S)-binding protein [Cytophagales bacterium]|nr:(Fe-S)-binding protein [Bernardetiaceae bacterium]MDW8211439.1 (Fe-S)-binding protein [Cytophagales bacterium]
MELFISIFQQLLFVASLAVTSWLVASRVRRIAANIKLGRSVERKDQPQKRLKNMLLMALGQKKMFDKPLVGLMHFVIYAAFIIINIEVLEILLDGLLGTHRLFAPYLGSLYQWLINFFELLALGVVVSCIIFLLRRNLKIVPRFWSREMTRWPRLDANIILLAEIFLMLCLFTMNATDSLLQTRSDSHYIAAHYPSVGSFWVSGLLTPLFSSLPTYALLLLERVAWWLHILGIMAFAVYITYSKHLHIALAFPNTYFSSLEPKGKIENMPVVTAEVKSMLGISSQNTQANSQEIGRFGAKDVQDLTWKNLMDAYSCTECGRCTAVCPANITGKLLSPRKIVMDTRDRLEEKGQLIALYGKDYDDGKSLYGDYITKEEVMACTTCNACVEACPVNINPLDIIVQIRQYIAMEEAATPTSWNAMFANIENNAAPWAFSASDRFNWAKELQEE